MTSEIPHLETVTLYPATTGTVSQTDLGDVIANAYIGSPGSTIFLIVAPIILGIGILGNIASFLVMTSRDMRSKPTSVYLATLAVFDTMTLFVAFYQYWYSMFYSINLKTNQTSCVSLNGSSNGSQLSPVLMSSLPSLPNALSSHGFR